MMHINRHKSGTHCRHLIQSLGGKGYVNVLFWTEAGSGSYKSGEWELNLENLPQDYFQSYGLNCK